jgi:hypothetical protein
LHKIIQVPSRRWLYMARKWKKSFFFCVNIFLHFISVQVFFFCWQVFLFSYRMNNEYHCYIVEMEKSDREREFPYACLQYPINAPIHCFVLHHHTFHSKLHAVQNIFTYLDISVMKWTRQIWLWSKAIHVSHLNEQYWIYE